VEGKRRTLKHAEGKRRTDEMHAKDFERLKDMQIEDDDGET